MWKLRLWDQAWFPQLTEAVVGGTGLRYNSLDSAVTFPSSNGASIEDQMWPFRNRVNWHQPVGVLLGPKWATIVSVGTECVFLMEMAVSWPFLCVLPFSLYGLSLYPFPPPLSSSSLSSLLTLLHHLNPFAFTLYQILLSLTFCFHSPQGSGEGRKTMRIGRKEVKLSFLFLFFIADLTI